MTDNRGAIIGNTISNSQVNTGHNARQTANWGVTETDKFEKFLSDIKNMQGISPEEIETSIDTVTVLKQQKEAGTLKSSFLERMWSLLPDAIKITAAAVEFYQVLAH